MAVERSEVPADALAARKSDSYKWYALGLVTLCYVFSYLDRKIFAILQEAIKADLHLNDTQLGFLGGLAFAFLYATFGIPMARFSDRYSRAKIIAGCIAAFSVMTALCGAARGFFTLALARIGVGIGEAGCNPASHSMISDYFGPNQRSTALAIFQMGATIGVALGFLIGGYVNLYLGWREAFVMVGAPGLIVALVVLFTLKEPVRGQSEARKGAKQNLEQPPFKEAALILWRTKTFRYLALAMGCSGFVSYGTAQWLPSFFIRTYGVDTGTLALYLSTIMAAAGAISVLSGGIMGDRLAKRDERWLCWLSCISIFGSKVLFLFVLFQPSFQNAILWLIAPTLLTGIAIGPTFAVVQGLVSLRMRALAASFIIFMNNMIGLGLGPLAVGIVSDILINAGIENSLRWALLLNTVFSVVAIAFFYLASRTVKQELAAAAAR